MTVMHPTTRGIILLRDQKQRQSRLRRHAREQCVGLRQYPPLTQQEERQTVSSRL